MPWGMEWGAQAVLPLYSDAWQPTLGFCLFSRLPSVCRSFVGTLSPSPVAAASFARYPSFQKGRSVCTSASLPACRAEGGAGWELWMLCPLASDSVGNTGHSLPFSGLFCLFLVGRDQRSEGT